MRFTESQFVRMTTQEKQLLLDLAAVEEHNPSDVIRRLIRQAAQSRKRSHDVTVSAVFGDAQNDPSDKN